MYTCYLCVPTLTSYNREQYHTCALNLQVKNFDHMEAHTSAKYQFLFHGSVSVVKTLDSGVITLRLTGQQTNCTWPNKNNVLLSILNYITVQGQTPNDLCYTHTIYYWTMIIEQWSSDTFYKLFSKDCSFGVMARRD